jgi:threonine/homoserine/homoserine lactone efflux protein
MADFIWPFLAYVAAAGLLAISPGLDTAMVLRASAVGGPRRGAAASSGICLGLAVWGAAAAFGLTALLKTSEMAFGILRWIGAAYLVLLGVKLVWKAGTSVPRNDGVQFTGGGAFRQGVLTNLLNPKVGIFYMSFLPQFIPHEANVAVFSLVLAAVHVVLTAAWFSLLVSLTVPLARSLSRPRVARTLDKFTGRIFLGFGLRLAIAERV